jgi:cytidylate kinase
VGFVIAVDGPAASGKGSIARRLGETYGLPVLDTGLLYRAVALAMTAEDSGPVADIVRNLDMNRLEEPALRTRASGEAASRVAADPVVRAALLDYQRRFAARTPGAVLDGRDIGTVIVPDAAVKLFVTASPRVRAERRWRELAGQGEPVDLAEVLADIRRRDARDGARKAAPMARAPDAVLLDTTDLDIDAAFDAARRIVEAARARWEKS